MRYQFECLACRHRFWRTGQTDEANAAVIDDPKGEHCPECESGDTEIVDETEDVDVED